MIAIRTIRARLRRMLDRERAAWLQHERGVGVGQCLASCEAAQQWAAARGVLHEAFEAVGARWPRWADGGGWEPSATRTAGIFFAPSLDQAPMPAVAGSEDA